MKPKTEGPLQYGLALLNEASISLGEAIFALLACAGLLERDNIMREVLMNLARTLEAGLQLLAEFETDWLQELLGQSA